MQRNEILQQNILIYSSYYLILYKKTLVIKRGGDGGL